MKEEFIITWDVKTLMLNISELCFVQIELYSPKVSYCYLGESAMCLRDTFGVLSLRQGYVFIRACFQITSTTLCTVL
jgi:hypothetical protein